MSSQVDYTQKRLIALQKFHRGLKITSCSINLAGSPKKKEESCRNILCYLYNGYVARLPPFVVRVCYWAKFTTDISGGVIQNTLDNNCRGACAMVSDKNIR